MIRTSPTATTLIASLLATTLSTALTTTVARCAPQDGQDSAPAPTSRADARAWPQWRGPARDGISKEADWSLEGKEKSVWLTNVGLGYSTVSVEGDRLYTIGHDKESAEDTVYCLDAATGADVWTFDYPCQTLAKYHGGGSLTTPSIDGPRLFVSNREGKLFCLDKKTGKALWQKDLMKQYDLALPEWGFAASPLVLDDMIVQETGHVFAFDRKGKEIWRTETDYKESYSTPAAVDLFGKPRLVCFNGKGCVVLDRKTGKEIASHPWKTRYNVNAATPVVLGTKIFISSGYGTGCALLEFTKDLELELLWENKEMRNHMSGCVAVGDYLYGFDESTFKCLDLEGNAKWQQRGLGKGAFVVAGDRLVMLSSRGDLVIAKATPEKYEELARKNVLSGGVYWTTPVICNGQIYARNSLGDLVCLDHRS
ncbi:MAG: PQQ-binding-like beta-propeller repeat protein [Planctomycetes bacterium]|nr:PQQ-binding-like beta-propeller repeat protein [Planctomycetota bacterium]